MLRGAARAIRIAIASLTTISRVRLVLDFSRLLDHAYLAFGDVRAVVSSVNVEGLPDVRVDLDEDGGVVGLEFREAFRRLGLGVRSERDEFEELFDAPE